MELEGLESPETLMMPGRVEKLVQEGRPPIYIGTLGPSGEEMLPWYQVPHKGYDPKKIKEVFMGSGALVFVYKNDQKRIGQTFNLTEEQADQVEQRKTMEQARLGIPDFFKTLQNEMQAHKDDKTLHNYIDKVKQTALMQTILPAERQKRVAHDFASRFHTIRDGLAALGCYVDLTGSRISNHSWRTTVHLNLPKEHKALVMKLIEKVDIKLPDQTMWHEARSYSHGLLLEDDFYSPSEIARIAKEMELVLYSGPGWQDEDTDMVKIDRQYDTDPDENSQVGPTFKA